MSVHSRRAVAIAAAAIGALIVGVGSGTAASRVEIAGDVVGLSAAGPRAALLVEHRSCDRIVAWRPAASRLSNEVERCNLEGVPVYGLQGLLLAGRQLAWVSYGGGNITEELLRTRPLGPGPRKVLAEAAFASDGFDGDDTYLGNVRGRGSAFSSATLVAWNTWRRCTVIGPSNDLGCEAPPGSSLSEGTEFLDERRVRVFDGSRVRTIAADDAAGPVVAVGDGLVAVRLDLGTTWSPLGRTLPAGAVTLLDATGVVVAQVPVPAGVWGGAELTQAALVVLVGQTLHVLDRTTGQPLAAWPVAPAAGPGAVRLTSVSPRAATVVSAGEIQVVRLADGQVARLGIGAVPGTLQAELEPQGLYVAWVLAGSTPRRSLVQLVPLARVMGGLAPGGA